mmetsp:Transcript_2563/g.9128  ORF Transcript_2563/g.9128 Transcript_2563/m.9128 type:complete len:235 (+) Transcript_2563:46-750(+)
MKIIGLTGGIASGKSTVTRVLQEEGITVIDADAIVKEIMLPGEPTYRKLVGHFGEGVLEEGGEETAKGRPIDKVKLSAIVFSDEKERKILNSISHEAVGKEMLRRVALAFLSASSAVVLDVPLLYEAKMDRYCTTVVVVNVNAELQRERLRTRNPELGEEGERRIAAQMPLEEKVKRAKYVIDNNGTLAETKAQVRRLVSDGVIPRSTPVTRALRYGVAIAVAGVLFFAVRSCF